MTICNQIVNLRVLNSKSILRGYSFHKILPLTKLLKIFFKYFPLRHGDELSKIKCNKITVSVMDSFQNLLRLLYKFEQISNFYFPWERKVNQFVQICLIIEAKFGDNPLKMFEFFFIILLMIYTNFILKSLDILNNSSLITRQILHIYWFWH